MLTYFLPDQLYTYVFVCQLVTDVLHSPMSPMSTYHGYHGGSETDTQIHSLQSPMSSTRGAVNLPDDASISSEKSRVTVVTNSGKFLL